MLENPFYYNEDAKTERGVLRERVLALLGAICFLILLAIATKAAAEEIPVHYLDKNGIEIRLMNTPCVDPKSIAQINPAFLERFKAIDSVWPERDGSRKRYAGCWAEIKKGEHGADEDTFIVVFEDNTNGQIPRSEFVKKPSA